MVVKRLKRNTEKIEHLETESQNPKSINIDIMTPLEIAKLMNEEDKTVAFAVEKVLSPIAQLAEEIAKSIHQGGKCFYIGAGTSGRLAVIDAAETVPTFNLAYGTFTAILAGGAEAMTKALEEVEDDEKSGANEMKKHDVSSKDVVVGISASGRTPYVIGALKEAKQRGALTGCVVNVSNSKMSSLVDVPIEAITGPEVVTGSTRLKAGTAQKMVLNMLSTISMVRLGKVYKNLMVDVTPINEKLVDRAVRIIMSATDVSREKAFELLKISNMKPKVAIVMALTGKGLKEAEELLKNHNGRIRDILA
jgi:N-acetylmuramic acid 6-phosphate etherase